MADQVSLFQRRMAVSTVQIVGKILEVKDIPNGKTETVSALIETTAGDVFEILVAKNNQGKIPQDDGISIFTCNVSSYPSKDGQFYNTKLYLLSVIEENYQTEEPARPQRRPQQQNTTRPVRQTREEPTQSKQQSSGFTGRRGNNVNYKNDEESEIDNRY